MNCKNYIYGIAPVAAAVVVIFGALVAAAAGIGADADGSLRWMDYIGIIIQFGPLMALAGLIAVGRQIADELRQDIRSAAASNLAAVEMLREQQQSFLKIIEMLSERK